MAIPASFISSAGTWIPSCTLGALQLAFFPPQFILPKYIGNPYLDAVLPQQRAQLQLASQHPPCPPIQQASEQTPPIDCDTTIVLASQCRAIMVAMERFKVNTNGGISGDGCLLQRLWTSADGEIAVFDPAHVAKRFAISATEAPFGYGVPSPKAKRREAKAAIEGADGLEGDNDKRDGGDINAKDGDVDADGRDDLTELDDNAAIQGLTNDSVTIPDLFHKLSLLPSSWYKRDRQNVPVACRLFALDVIDGSRGTHKFTADIVDAFGRLYEAWDVSHLTMQERKERVNHFRRTVYPLIIDAMCRPGGPPEYVCGWHRITIESITNIAEALLLIDEAHVSMNGPNPKLNWVQRAIGTDVLENTFSNERATLGLNSRADSGTTSHDEVRYACAKTMYLIHIFANRQGEIHDPGFKHRAAGHIKPLEEQGDWGTPARLDKKLKRSRPSQSGEEEDGSAVKRKKETFKAVAAVDGNGVRARLYHKIGPVVASMAG